MTDPIEASRPGGRRATLEAEASRLKWCPQAGGSRGRNAELLSSAATGRKTRLGSGCWSSRSHRLLGGLPFETTDLKADGRQ
jgi:hypothetical protein